MLLPFFGYLLCFQNSMVGPFIFYTEYLCFIEGREEDLFSDPLERELVVSLQWFSLLCRLISSIHILIA